MKTRMLVAYSASSTYVQTTADYLDAIRRFTDYDVEYVHVTHDAVMNFDFSGFDVVFHSYCARLCFEGYVCESYRAALRSFGGVKVLAVQDEYDETDRLKRAIGDLGFHIVLTCVPQNALEYVYPRQEFPRVKFVTVFTGYAAEDSFAAGRKVKRLAERGIVLGYRGRDIGGRYGRLADDKFEIGRRMKELCSQRGIPHDISTRELSRIYGLAWLDFIGDCRAMLGTESGSNVFDFDGSIQASYRDLAKALGRRPNYEEFVAAEPIVAVKDQEISMGQISPRVFECAVMRTPMILFEGRYSGVIAPHDHYIPLKRDFSNVDDVLARLEDIDGLEAMAGRAHRHLIASGQFAYSTLWQQIRDEIDESARTLPSRDPPARIDAQLETRPARTSRLAETTTLKPMGRAHFERKRPAEFIKARVRSVPWLIGLIRKLRRTESLV